MTDTSKSAILAVGGTLISWMAGVMVGSLSQTLLLVVKGPAMLVFAIAGRLTPLWLRFFIVHIPIAVLIYFLALALFQKPPYWRLRVGLFIFLWMMTGYIGYLVMNSPL